MYFQAIRFEQPENFEFWNRLMSHVEESDNVYRNPAQVFPPGQGKGPDAATMDDAAKAWPSEEVAADSNQPINANSDGVELDAMNIDELRVVAKELDVPQRETITDRDDLIAAIRKLY